MVASATGQAAAETCGVRGNGAGGPCERPYGSSRPGYANPRRASARSREIAPRQGAGSAAQVASGSKRVIALAMEAVAGPRFFWYTTPS